MTKKDYIKIAGALKASREEWEHLHNNLNTVNDVAHKIARVFAEDNPRFDVERFLEACGVPREEWNL